MKLSLILHDNIKKKKHFRSSPLMVLLRFLLLRVFHSFNVLLKWGRDISDSKQFENDSAPRENTLKSLIDSYKFFDWRSKEIITISMNNVKSL